MTVYAAQHRDPLLDNQNSGGGGGNPGQGNGNLPGNAGAQNQTNGAGNQTPPMYNVDLDDETPERCKFI